MGGGELIQEVGEAVEQTLPWWRDVWTWFLESWTIVPGWLRVSLIVLLFVSVLFRRFWAPGIALLRAKMPTRNGDRE